MPQDADQVITERGTEKDRVIKRVTEPLQRPIEIRSGGVNEKEMIEPLMDEAPAPNERVAQNQGRIVPDKTVAQSGRIANEDNCKNDKDGPDFFHERESID